MKIYAVGTIIANNIGYCKYVINLSKRRNKTEERGTFKLSRAVDVPSGIRLSWVDNKPVHCMSPGASGSQARVTRHLRGGDLEVVS